MTRTGAISVAFTCIASTAWAQATLPKQPYVIDNAGKVIGSFSSGAVYIPLTANLGAFVLVNQAGFLADSPLYYGSTNCTGTPFLKARDVFPTYGSVLNRTLYYPFSQPTRNLTARSSTYLDFNGCVPTNTLIPAVPAGSSDIVQTYAAPFTIRPR